MSNPQLKRPPIAKSGMLIRKPVADVFAAFIDPQVTTHFWFTKSSGQLEVGKEIKWEWEMYDVSTLVMIKAVEANKHILIEWDGYSGRTVVEWKFTPLEPNATFVSITESGWTGDADELLECVADSTEGFAWTLAGLKAFLEHNIELNLVRDRFPKGLEEHLPDQ